MRVYARSCTTRRFFAYERDYNSRWSARARLIHRWRCRFRSRRFVTFLLFSITFVHIVQFYLWRAFRQAFPKLEGVRARAITPTFSLYESSRCIRFFYTNVVPTPHKTCCVFCVLHYRCYYCSVYSQTLIIYTLLVIQLLLLIGVNSKFVSFLFRDLTYTFNSYCTWSELYVWWRYVPKRLSVLVYNIHISP